MQNITTADSMVVMDINGEKHVLEKNDDTLESCEIIVLHRLQRMITTCSCVLFLLFTPLFVNINSFFPFVCSLCVFNVLKNKQELFPTGDSDRARPASLYCGDP